MSAGHTQGDWSAEPGQDGTFGLYSRDPRLGTQLIGEFFDEDMGDPLPALANLKLAAAAPELLAALIEARAALHQHYVDWDGEPEDAVPLQLARSKCDAAIAKATGASAPYGVRV